MGLSPLSFTEIKAYIDSTQTPLNGDEVMLIRKMSQGYVSELNDKNPTKTPPFGEYKVKSNSLVNALKNIAQQVQ